MAHLKSLLLACCYITVVFLLAFCASEEEKKAEEGKEHPKGHQQPLGFHRPAEGNVDTVTEFPEPTEFYEKYVKPGIPVLFQGLAFRMPSFKDWTDDEVLKKKFGDIEVEIEHGKDDNRDAGVTFSSFAEFVDNYKKLDQYLVHNVDGPMRDDYYISKPLLCGGFTKFLREAVMWFSGGGTTSGLHSDGIDNINCIFDGWKTMVMIDKKYEKQVKKIGWNFNGAHSNVKPLTVDMYKFPNLSDLPWFNATMKKGDCLYIPIGWFHQVNSYGERNVAINTWLSHIPWFNKTDCENKKDLPDFDSYSKYKTEDPLLRVRQQFFEVFAGLDKIRSTNFKKRWSEVVGSNAKDKKAFAIIDANEDGVLSWEELFTFNLKAMRKLYPSVTADLIEQVVGEGEREPSVQDLHNHDEL